MLSTGRDVEEDTDTKKVIKLLNGLTCTLYQCKAEHCAQFLGEVKIGTIHTVYACHDTHVALRLNASNEVDNDSSCALPFLNLIMTKNNPTHNRVMHAYHKLYCFRKINFRVALGNHTLIVSMQMVSLRTCPLA
jgi:hypothetical protein